MPLDRPSVPEVLPLAKRLYELNGVGGPLHNVLDDGNLEDSSIQWCLDNMDDGEFNWSEEERRLARQIGEQMLQMTMTQRRKIYRLV